LSGPDGSHFLGTDEPNLVIGFDSTGDRHNIGQDTSYDTQKELVGSSNHIAVGVVRYQSNRNHSTVPSMGKPQA